MKYKILLDKRPSYAYQNFFFDDVLPFYPKKSMSVKLNLEPSLLVNSTISIGFNDYGT